MRIDIFARNGETFTFMNVDDYKIHNYGGLGILIVRHDKGKMEYFRLGYVNHWSVSEGDE